MFIFLTNKHFQWERQVEADQIECDPNTFASTPSCWSVETHHLERAEVEIALCGLTKKAESLLDFLILFVTSLYLPRCDRAQISVSLYRIKTIGSKSGTGRVCLSNSKTNIVTLSVSKFITSQKKLTDLYGLLLVIIELLSCIIRCPGHIHQVKIRFWYINISHAVVYLGKECLRF